MRWRFRQSFKLIPGVKLNLGKKGVSLSFGGAPFTLNVGTRGVYGTASIPGTGVQFRQRFGGGPSGERYQVHPRLGRRRSLPAVDLGSLPPQLPGGMFQEAGASPPAQEIRSADTELLTSEGLRQLKQWLQTAYEEHEQIANELGAAQAEEAQSLARFALWDNGFLFKRVFVKSFEKRKLAAETASAKRQELEEQLRLTTIAAQIDMATEQAELFFRMRDEFSQLSESAAIWDITSQRETDRVRERTQAGRTVSRKPVKFDLASSNLITWDQHVPHLQNMNGGDLFLYPGFTTVRLRTKSK